MTAYVRKLIKWFYLVVALAVIFIAVLVQAGRIFSPMLADYRLELGHYFSSKLNAKVTVGAIKAEWIGLKPTVEIRNLHILSQSDQPILMLGHARMRLDLAGSFVHFRPVWSALQIEQVQLDFVQTEEGVWQVQGMPKRTEVKEHHGVQLDSVIDMSLLSRRIELSDSQLRFHFVSGATAVLQSPLLRMENTGDFHRLSLQVDVDGSANTLALMVEGYGDPRQRETFSSKGFLQLKKFPTSEPIAATTAFLLRGIKAEVHSQGTIDGELWFTSRPQHEGLDVVGSLNIERLNLPMLGKSLSLDSFSTAITGHWLYSGQWQLALQDVSAAVNENRVEHINIAASAASFTDPVVVHLPKVNLQGLNQTLDSAGVLGDGKLRDVMRQLDPQGELHSVEIAIPPKNPVDWELKANLAKVGVNAWQGVPALRRVDGFVQATKTGGYVDIDSRDGFSMHYSPTYSAPMEYKQAKGQVAWWLQPEQNQIYVNSGALEFIDGDEYAKGYMWLALPWKRNSGDIDLYLQIGAKKLDASLYSKYTPAVVPRSLLDWLSKSIGTDNPGFVDQVGFVYRGTLNNHDRVSRTHQLFVDIQHAALNFHQEWPALKSINGRLLVSDENVAASIDKATLFNSEVGTTQVNVSPNPDGHGSLLHVKGSVKGEANDGLRVLRESMLRRYIGNSLDTWMLDGNMQTQLDIAVPLDSQGTGAAQQIDIDLDSPNFQMTNLKLSLQHVRGHLSFDQTSGLNSDGLSGILFDEPVNAALTTRKQGELSQTLVDVKGEVSSSALARWTQRPEVLFLQGQIPYTAQVQLNHRGAGDAATPFTVVKVDSPLSNVHVDLPFPYGKSVDQERSLSFKMSMFEQKSLIDVTYGDSLQALIELDSQHDNKLLNANIALNDTAKLATEPQFLLSGNLPGLDIEPWKKVQQRYLDYVSQIDAAKPKTLILADASSQPSRAPEENSALVAGLPFRADVNLEHYQVGPLTLDNVKVNAERLSESWKIVFANPLVDGRILIPNDSRKPLLINLESLRLKSSLLNPVTDTQNNSADLLHQPARLPRINLDPRSLPFADISVKALYMDDVNYGDWSLQVRPQSQGVLFDNIRGTVKGVSISGLDKNDPSENGRNGGAKLEWLLTETGPSTHFLGELSAADMSTVLREWQKPDTLESQFASFKIDTTWGGDPQDFALKKIAGTVDIWIEKGRFKSNPSPGSDGFLRLMAILNFDSLARRLRLDFSDLYQSGLAYDQIKGKVSFQPGTMIFIEPLEVKTPSSRLQLAGKLDLENEKIDSRLVATLPVVGSYTFFTALVTGLPAAAGIYFVSKLFKKQVDRATSISYRIRGNWSNPKMSFDRLFESEDDLLESVNNPEVPAYENAKQKDKRLEAGH